MTSRITGMAVLDAMRHAMRLASKWGGVKVVFAWRRKLYVRPCAPNEIPTDGAILIGVADGTDILNTKWTWILGGKQ